MYHNSGIISPRANGNWIYTTRDVCMSFLLFILMFSVAAEPTGTAELEQPESVYVYAVTSNVECCQCIRVVRGICDPDFISVIVGEI